MEMKDQASIVVLGTFDSKGDEHLFLKEAILKRGLPVLTVNVGTMGPSRFAPDFDLKPDGQLDRDQAIGLVIQRARTLLLDLYRQGRVAGVISAGGGSGTHLSAGVMRVLPFGVPKVMVSTVASRNMAEVVGTRDLTVMHSVGDLLGVNSITGPILDRAAGAVCGQVRSQWTGNKTGKTIALTMFGFITSAAEAIKAHLEALGHEVIAFHANGVGGLAMEELAAEGRFDGILDLATHELADSLYPGGYCRLIGPGRLEPVPGVRVPRLLVPGGLDCIVLEFTRQNVPPEFHDRRIFFYDFRSAINVSAEEAQILTGQLLDKINRSHSPLQVLIPTAGWSGAVDGQGRTLYDFQIGTAMTEQLKREGHPRVPVITLDVHILDTEFAAAAARMMNEMLE